MKIISFYTLGGLELKKQLKVISFELISFYQLDGRDQESYWLEIQEHTSSFKKSSKIENNSRRIRE